MRTREAGGARHVVDPERLDVARVSEVLGAQQMTGRWDGDAHGARLRLAHQHLARRQ
jgi:hypothetical protein